ncbi:MAG: tetratricopeptide repeat protein [Spirochaetales bacterium]|nr:tetratricopeptide repeat protein [Spirochaetales bacterium]
MGSLIKGRLFLVFITLATISTVLFTLKLNDVVISLRLLELEAHLRDINRESSQTDHLSIVAKFQLHKRLYEGKSSEADLQAKELKNIRLQRFYESQNVKKLDEWKYYPPVLVEVINLIRMILQKPRIQSILSDPLGYDLALAYYHERQKDWKDALEIYKEILANKEIPDKRISNVYLHQGYCQAILSDYAAAKNSFGYIIEEFSHEDTAITAAILHQYIDDIEREIINIKNSKVPEIEKSQKYYELLNYDEALKSLGRVTQDEPTSNDTEQYNYLKARIYEETGDQDKALKLYQNIITDSGFSSETAKLSNRRLLTLATSVDAGDKVMELARMNNKLLMDEKFLELSKQAEDIRESLEKDEILSEQIMNRSPSPSPTTETEEQSPEPVPQNEVVTTAENSLEILIQIIIEQTEASIAKYETLITPTPIEPIINTPSPAPTPEPTPKTLVVKEGLEPRIIIDNEGNQKRMEYWDEQGNLVYYMEYEYDANGNPIGLKKFDPQGNVVEVEIE